MSKSTRPRRARKSAKPPKPYPEFPLGSSTNGYWQKRIRGTLHYFGRWGKIVDGKMERLPGDGWQEALALFKAQNDDLQAGRTPRVDNGELTVKGLCNEFLEAMLQRLKTGRKMSPRMFTDYGQTAQRLADQFGKTRRIADLRPKDFTQLLYDLPASWGPVRTGNFVQRVKTIFTWGLEQAHIDGEVRFGSEFKKPDKSVIRKNRHERGEKLFTPPEIRTLIDSASVPLRAMILLGINAAFGNNDVAALPQSAVTLDCGLLDFPRPQNHIRRKAVLWPETVEALRKAIAERPDPKSTHDAELVFVTRDGYRFVRMVLKDPTSSVPVYAPVDSVGCAFGKLLRKLDLHRPGAGFYWLRHTFRTVADATLDFPAVRRVMGHSTKGIDDVYIEGLDDARLQRVAAHVHGWLFPPSAEDNAEGGAR